MGQDTWSIPGRGDYLCESPEARKKVNHLGIDRSVLWLNHCEGNME